MRPMYRCSLLAALAFTLISSCALWATPASARVTRLHQSSFGSFDQFFPKTLAVDQTTGDVYVLNRDVIPGEGEAPSFERFTAAGAPHNFTAGPDAGSNVLAAVHGAGDMAIDNSGGPLDGSIYVADSVSHTVKVFSRTGASLGSIVGLGTEYVPPSPPGHFPASSNVRIGVDQSTGALYVVAERVWRYMPSSPNGALDDSDYTLTGIATEAGSVDVAANDDNVYLVQSDNSLARFAASDFSKEIPRPTGRIVDVGPGAIRAIDVDPQNGDVYIDHGREVWVSDPNGTFLYRFGSASDLGTESAGIAIKSAATGPASTVYVADPSTERTVDVFGPLTTIPSYTHSTIASFGPDGTSSSSFGTPGLSQLAMHGSARSLYALAPLVPGIVGFDASTPPAFAPLSPFSTAAIGENSALAVDNTGLSSAGNIYLASSATDLLYGFDATGTPLAGAFPIDPASDPGSPAGSPKDLCGVATDPGGDIWVANSAADRILRYSSAGVYKEAVDVTAQGAPCQLAFDTNDDLYVDFDMKGAFRFTAVSGYSQATKVASGGDSGRNGVAAISVDPSTHHLYVAYERWVDEFDAAGVLVDEFATGLSELIKGLVVDPVNHNIYLSSRGGQIEVLGPGVLLPEARTTSPSALANTIATLNGVVGTQGEPLSDCHFEYVTNASFQSSGFSDLSSGGSAPCMPAAGSIPLDLDEHAVSADLSGLSRDTEYRFRVLAANANGGTAGDAVGLITASQPGVETTGTPIRTATTAQLLGRVNPKRESTTIHFEYGDQGPCDSNPCASTSAEPAGNGDLTRLASAQLEGLQPSTTYHYRIVAENGNTDGPAFGADEAVTTRPSDAPLTHGNFPGPPGSDRAYEQVSLADAGGNPVGFTQGLSEDGNAAIYGIFGGTPISNSGSLLSFYYAERPSGTHPGSGWETKLITPARDELSGANWLGLSGRDDLSSLVAPNYPTEPSEGTLWRFEPAGHPTKLFSPTAPTIGIGLSGGTPTFGTSADGTRVIGAFEGGTLDPAYPAAAGVPNLYDVSSGGDPQLLSLLPGNVPASCGVRRESSASDGAGAFGSPGLQASHWISEDGSLVFFASRGNGPCSGSNPSRLYLRDIEAEQTTLVSGPVLSGPTCDGAFVKATATTAFFTTASRLASEDSAPASCQQGNDIYAYEIGDGTLRCLTCAAGQDAEVLGSSPSEIAVSEDGSRIYFESGSRLLPGAPDGSPGIYRLDVDGSELAYVAPAVGKADIGSAQVTVGLTPDGSVLVFRSSAVALNPLGGGSDNGAAAQYYRYDDGDRSLVCVSCPADGSPPTGLTDPFVEGGYQGQPNLTGISDDGLTIAFVTPTPLVGDDQNTPSGGNGAPGKDVYEWRDGRQLLITDGLTSWSYFPYLGGVSASGRDVFFSATAQYTADAPDANRRFYDARIGGGMEFPAEAKPCPLEVCQGTPKGAPEESSPSSGSFGPGNGTPPPAARTCPKGKVKKKSRCVARKPASKRRKAKQHRANHDRRTHR